MAKTLRLKETLAEALDVQSVWQAIPDFKMGDVSLTDFTAANGGWEYPALLVVLAVAVALLGDGAFALSGNPAQPVTPQRKPA